MKKIPLILLTVLAMMIPVTNVIAGNCHVVSRQNYAVANTNYVDYPVIQRVQVVPDFFYSSRDYLRDERETSYAKLMERQLALTERLLDKVQTQPVSTSQSSVPKVLSLSDLPALKEVGESGIESVVAESCIKCHNGKKGHLDLSNFESLTRNQKEKIANAILYDEMPPKERLTKDQKKVVHSWQKNGYQ